MSSTAPIFPDTEAMDRAFGRVSLRRVFPVAGEPSPQDIADDLLARIAGTQPQRAMNRRASIPERKKSMNANYWALMWRLMRGGR
jgi:hypothetical protein